MANADELSHLAVNQASKPTPNTDSAYSGSFQAYPSGGVVGVKLFLPDGDFRLDAVGADRGCFEGVLAVCGGSGDDEGGFADF